MGCVNDFILTRGVDNMFTFVIKQTGSTLPMEIINNELNKKTWVTPKVEYIPYSPVVEPHYVATNEPLTVNIAEFIQNLNVVNIKVQPEVSIDNLKVNGSTIPLVDGWYEIGNVQEFVVTPVTVTEQLEKPLPDIELKLKITLIDTIDKFSLTMFDIETDEIVLELNNTNETSNGSKIIVEDAVNGKLGLIVNKEDISNLKVSKGDNVDRFYLKPTYRMIMDCSTFNNGNFMARIDFVYVE